MTTTRRTFLASALGAVLAGALPRAIRAAAAGGESDGFTRIAGSMHDRRVAEMPIGAAIVEIGRGLLGTPYASNTLEVGEQEQCVVTFSGLDCVTFFELALDLARIARKHSVSFDALQREVTFTRYRGGQLTNYASRLHYTTDWMYDNAMKSVVLDVTPALGGVAYLKRIDFMSTHPEKYRQLRDDPSLVSAIRTIEQQIAARPLLYIPKSRVPDIESQLQAGDIIGITTTIAGIDCSHTGVVVRDGSHARFMHASSTKGQVIITDGTLSEYLDSVSKHTGIMVVRPLEPRG